MGFLEDFLESMILNFTEDSNNTPSGGNNDELTNQAQGPYDGSLSFVSI